MSINSSATNSVPFSYIYHPDPRIAQKCPNFPNLLITQLSRATTLFATCSCRFYTCLCSFADYITFKFSKCGKYVEHQLSCSTSRFYFFSQALKSDFFVFKLSDYFHQVGQRTT